MIQIRDSIGKDVDLLAPIMREADKQEAMAAAGSTPLETLREAIRVSSPCLTAMDGETPLAMFGVTPAERGSGVVWFLGSDAATERPREMMRLSRLWLGRFRSQFPLLWNFVDARNTVHIRWIRSMGFEFLSTHHDFGHSQLPFHFFYINGDA